jgi:hypothetical protein
MEKVVFFFFYLINVLFSKTDCCKFIFGYVHNDRFCNVEGAILPVTVEEANDL